MSKRMTNTEIWGEDWFLSLSIEQKLIYFYMRDNCDAIGMFKPSKIASFATGVTVSPGFIDGMITALGDRIKKLDDNVYLFADFVKEQYGKLNYNCRPHRPVIEMVKNAGLEDMFEFTEPEMKKAPKRTKADIHDKAVESMVIPDNLDTDRFREVFIDFCDNRKEMKKYLTARSIKTSLNKLAKFTVEEAIDACIDSVANNWQGLFPKKGSSISGAARGWGSPVPPRTNFGSDNSTQQANDVDEKLKGVEGKQL